MARLTTHVLDTASGTQASGIVIDLYLLGEERRHLCTAVTNRDGRTDDALLSGDHIEPGVYELTFQAGDYFRQSAAPPAEPPFLDVVVIRFGIADPFGHYHVPLLLSPYGYTTYRGS